MTAVLAVCWLIASGSCFWQVHRLLVEWEATTSRRLGVLRRLGRMA